MWTSDQIADRLGISTAVFQNHQLGGRHIAQIREAGMRRIEISSIPRSIDICNAEQNQEIREACSREGIKVVSVHGPFGLPYGELDESIRKTVVDGSLAAIRFAEEMGASTYVAHFGHGVPGRRTIEDLLEATADLAISLTTENQVRQPFEPYIDFVKEIGSDRFGLTVDIGHARDSDGVNPFVKQESARKELLNCGDSIRHLHLHETFERDQKPDHHPPMHPEGIINWGEIFGALFEMKYSGDFIFEDGRGENPEEWIRYTAEFPATFVGRYSV